MKRTLIQNAIIVNEGRTVPGDMGHGVYRGYRHGYSTHQEDSGEG